MTSSTSGPERLMCMALTSRNESATDGGQGTTERIDYLNTVIR